VVTDEQLAASAQQGSVAAFSELVERYQARLFRFLLVRCTSPADAEDAIQDTFMNAYRYIDSFNPRWRFSTWLFRIALRNAAKMTRVAVAAQGEAPGDGGDPLATCIAVSDRQNLWLTARAVLSADAYSAMWLRYVEDMSVREVARALGRSISWTKVILLRSRRQLSAELASGKETGADGEAYG
jgi:RNA polymerase sigma-70 factor, ECF subfamily